MAVTLTIADLRQPIGELSAELFAGTNFDTLLTGWLAQAVAKVGAGVVDENAAAAAWVYYRAYSYKAALQANTPNQVNFSNQPGVSKTMSADQREYFINLAEHWKSIFDGYVVPPVVVGGAFTGSQSVSVLPRW